MKKTNSQERLKELLMLNDETQADMARKSGLTRTTISRFVNGIQTPNQDSIDKISKAYQISPAWLMGYNVDMNQKTDKEILKYLSMLDEQDKQFVVGIIKYLSERS